MTKKIAYLINTIDQHGPGNVVINIINNLNKKKFDIYLITLMKGNNLNIIDKLKSDGIGVIECNCKNKIDFLFNIRQIKKIIEKNKFDIIHSHGIMPDYISYVVKGKVKKISTIHCNIFEDYKQQFNKIKATFAIHCNKFLYNKLDLNICCSKSVYDSMKKYIKKIDYVRNGIDVKAYENNTDIRKELKIKKNDIIYIYSGKLIKRKRVLELVELFKKHHKEDEFLIIIGNGTEYDNCVKAVENDLNIKFLGYKKNIYDYYCASDVYISNSSSEGFSISCLEALGTDNYLFLSNIPSHSELFEDCNIYIGELFSDEDDFKNKINKIRSMVKREEGIQKCSLSKYQKRNFSSNKMTKLYEDKYLKL